MCGIVGLFVGCELAPVCPRHTRRHDVREGAAATYRSAFGSWDERASVRRAPRRTLAEPSDSQAPPLFSPSLVPVASHTMVRELEPAATETLLARHALRYLDFTAKLEHLVVNQAVLSIANGACGVGLPEEMRLDAYRIYCDEAYHALFSVDLIRQIERRTGVVRSGEDPYFLTAFAGIRDRLPSEHIPLAWMLFVIVSETLITASLSESSRKADMDPGLRASLEDHASDEGRHHVYFVAYLRRLWGHLRDGERELAVELLPDLLRAFLHPDLRGMADDLRAVGFSAEDAEQIVAETCPPETVRQHTARSASKTIEYFRQLGALEGNEVNERLAGLGVAGG